MDLITLLLPSEQTYVAGNQPRNWYTCEWIEIDGAVLYRRDNIPDRNVALQEAQEKLDEVIERWRDESSRTLMQRVLQVIDDDSSPSSPPRRRGHTSRRPAWMARIPSRKSTQPLWPWTSGPGESVPSRRPRLLVVDVDLGALAVDREEQVARDAERHHESRIRLVREVHDESRRSTGLSTSRHTGPRRSRRCPTRRWRSAGPWSGRSATSCRSRGRTRCVGGR